MIRNLSDPLITLPVGCRGLRSLGVALLTATALVVATWDLGDAVAQEKYYLSAERYLQEGDYNAAFIEIKNALRGDPDNPQARVLLGKIYLRLGDPKAAETAFLRARELGAEDEELDLLLAYARLGQGAFSQVLSGTVPPGAGQSNLHRDLIVARGDALLALGKQDEARDAYDRVLAQEPHALAFKGKAAIAFLQGDIPKAREFLDRALELAPEHEDIVAADAEWYFSRGQFDAARTRYEKAVELNPVKLLPRIGLVRSQLAAGDIEAAQEGIGRLKKAQPQSNLVLFQDSVVQLAAGNFEAAKRSADQVLGRDRYHTLALNVAGTSAYALGQYEQSVARLTNYLQARPDDHQIRLVLAAAYLRLGKPANAKTALRPVLAAQAENARALSLMSTAEAMEGNSEAAAQYLERAAAATPGEAALQSELGLLRVAIERQSAGTGELAQFVEASPGQAGADGIDANEITLILGHLRSGNHDMALENIRRLQEVHPANVRLFVLAGIAHAGRGESELAQAAFSRAIELDPGSADARLNLARLRATQGDYDGARKLLEGVLARQPQHYMALIELANLAGRRGNIREQVDWLEQVVAARPTQTAPRRGLAQLYLQNGAAQKALDTAAPGLEQQPDNPELLRVVGQAQLQTGRAEEAIATFERLVAVVPQDADANFQLARALGLSGKHEQMRASLQRALEIDPQHIPSQVSLVRYLALDGQMGEAKTRMQSLKRNYPDHPEVLAQEGWVLLREGQPAEAAQSLQAALERMPEGANREIVESLARAYWEAGQRDASMAVREDWLESNPDDLPMLTAVGQNYMQVGRFGDAITTYRRVHALAPQSVIALNNLAWLLQKSAPDEALGYAEQAAQLAPGTPWVIDTLGWLLLERGETSRATGLFEEAVKKAPGNPQYRYHLAQALDRGGQAGRARQILEELLQDERLEAEHDKIRTRLQSLD